MDACTLSSFDSCGTVSKWLSEIIVYLCFTSFMICCVMVVATLWGISPRWSWLPCSSPPNELIQKYSIKLFCIAGASMVSSLVAISFVLDPIWWQSELTGGNAPHLNAVCQAQALSMEFVYLFSSIIPFIVLEMYKLGLSKILNKFICCKKHNYAFVSPKSVASDEPSLSIESGDNNKCKSISVGLIWIMICIITCLIAVFGYDIDYGYVGQYKEDIIDNTRGWYGCYCQSAFACYVIWGGPHIILEIYFVITALRAFNLTVHRSKVEQARVVAYVVIRSIIIAWSLPMVLRNINNQRSADDFAGYMSLTIVFASLLSVFFMVLPILIAAYNGQSKFYSIDSDRSIWSPSSSRKNSNNKQEIHDNEFEYELSIHRLSEPKTFIDTDTELAQSRPYKTTLSSEQEQRLSELDVIDEGKVSFNNVPDFPQSSPDINMKMTTLTHTISQSPAHSLSFLPENTPPPLQNQPTLTKTTKSCSESKTKTNTDTTSSSSTEPSSHNSSTKYSHLSNTKELLGDASNPISSKS